MAIKRYINFYQNKSKLLLQIILYKLDFDFNHHNNKIILSTCYLLKKNLIILSLLNIYDDKQLKKMKVRVSLPSGIQQQISMDDNKKVMIKQSINKRSTIVYLRIKQQQELKIQQNKNQIKQQQNILDILKIKYKLQLNQFYQKMLNWSLDEYQQRLSLINFKYRRQQSAQKVVKKMQTHFNNLLQNFQQKIDHFLGHKEYLQSSHQDQYSISQNSFNNIHKYYKPLQINIKKYKIKLIRQFILKNQEAKQQMLQKLQQLYYFLKNKFNNLSFYQHQLILHLFQMMISQFTIQKDILLSKFCSNSDLQQYKLNKQAYLYEENINNRMLQFQQQFNRHIQSLNHKIIKKLASSNYKQKEQINGLVNLTFKYVGKSNFIKFRQLEIKINSLFVKKEKEEGKYQDQIIMSPINIQALYKSYPILNNLAELTKEQRLKQKINKVKGYMNEMFEYINKCYTSSQYEAYYQDIQNLLSLLYSYAHNLLHFTEGKIISKEIQISQPYKNQDVNYSLFNIQQQYQALDHQNGQQILNSLNQNRQLTQMQQPVYQRINQMKQISYIQIQFQQDQLEDQWYEINNDIYDQEQFINKKKKKYQNLQIAQYLMQQEIKEIIIDPVCIQIMNDMIQTIQKKLCIKHNRQQLYYVCKNEIFKRNYYLCNQCIIIQNHKDHNIICRRHRLKVEYIQYKYQVQQSLQKFPNSQYKQLFLCRLCPKNQTVYRLTQCHHEAIEKVSYQFNQNTFFYPNRQFIHQCPKCFQKEFKENEILEMNEQNKGRIKDRINSRFNSQINMSYFENILSELEEKLQLRSLNKIHGVYLQKSWFIWSYLNIYHLTDTSKRDSIVEDMFSNPNNQNLFKLWLINNKQFFRYDEQTKYKFLQFISDKITPFIEDFFSAIASKINSLVEEMYRLILNENQQQFEQHLNKKYQTVINRKDKSNYRKRKIQQGDVIYDENPTQIYEVSPANLYQIENHYEEKIRHLIIEKDVEQFEQVSIKQLIQLGHQFKDHCYQNRSLFNKYDLLQFKKLYFKKDQFNLEIKIYKSNQQEITIENKIRKQNEKYLKKEKKQEYEQYLINMVKEREQYDKSETIKDKKELCPQIQKNKAIEWFQIQKIEAVILFSQSRIQAGKLIKHPKNPEEAACQEHCQRYHVYIKTLQLIKKHRLIKKQWQQRLEQPKLFKLIIDKNITNLISIIIKYNHYDGYGDSDYNYSMSSFDLFKVISLNKCLKLCSVQGIKITEFTKFMKCFRINREGNQILQLQQIKKQQKIINLIKNFSINNNGLQLNLPGVIIQVKMENLQQSKQIIKDLYYMQAHIPYIIMVNLNFKINNLNLARNNISTIVQLLQVLKKIKDLQLHINNGYDELKILNNTEPISFILQQLTTFNNIKGIAFEQIILQNALQQQQKDTINKYIRLITTNNPVEYFSLKFCQNFTNLPKFSNNSLKNFTYYQGFNQGVSGEYISQLIKKNSHIETLILNYLNYYQSAQDSISFEGMDALKQLTLRGKYFNDKYLSSLSQKAAYNLEYLYLDGMEYYYQCPDVNISLKIILPKLCSLTKLTLKNIKFDAQYLLLIPSIYLNSLSYVHCESITDEILLGIDKKWPFIKYLQLYNCKNVEGRYINDNAFRSLIKLSTFNNTKLNFDQRYMLSLRGVIVDQQPWKKNQQDQIGYSNIANQSAAYSVPIKRPYNQFQQQSFLGFPQNSTSDIDQLQQLINQVS